MEKSSLLDRFNHWARNSVSLKLFTIGILILLLLIPSAIITSLISEREETRDEAVRDVSSKWGNSQQIAGPVISIPYLVYTRDKDGSLLSHREYAHFLPDQINISGSLIPEKRYRGIYVVVLYNARLRLEGVFSKPNTGILAVPNENFLLNEAFLTLGITDMKGIRESIQVKLNDTAGAFQPGIITHDIFSSGVSLPVKVDGDRIRFDLKLDINGSTSVSFAPMAKETNVQITSSWPNPSFEGSFLPVTRNVSADGFEARWKVLELNRNYPQQGKGRFITPEENDGNFTDASTGLSDFGVRLLLPVDEYQKTMRSAKYCIMFIILTFLAFFFVEVFVKKRLHPLQYLLLGFAVVLFYILLLSISEHLDFNLAYLISCLLILSLISLYAWAVFRDKKVASLIFVLLSMLYAFFYSLLQLQDYALLMGSLGLLIILASLMYLTRNIDWYAIGQKRNEE